MPVCCAQSSMSSYSVQQNAERAREELSPFVSLASERRDPVCCPRPRRMTHLSGSEPIRPLRRLLGQQGTHGGGGQVASSPPYFCGSPPSRAANPLVLDARFSEENAVLPAPSPTPTASAASSSSTGGRKDRVRASLGANPAAVRIEGFDCLDRGGGRRESCSSISAVA